MQRRLIAARKGGFDIDVFHTRLGVSETVDESPPLMRIEGVDDSVDALSVVVVSCRRVVWNLEQLKVIGGLPIGRVRRLVASEGYPFLTVPNH